MFWYKKNIIGAFKFLRLKNSVKVVKCILKPSSVVVLKKSLLISSQKKFKPNNNNNNNDNNNNLYKNEGITDNCNI